MIKNIQRKKVIIVAISLVAVGLYILAEANALTGIIILIFAIILLL